MSKRKKKKQINLRVLIGSSLTVLVIIISAISFHWSSFIGIHLVKNINIKGAVIIPEKDYKQNLEPLLGSSIHNLDLNEIGLLYESHPFVQATRVSRSYPNTVSIEIIERNPVAMLNMNPILFIDNEGVVMPELGNVNDRIIPIMSGFNSARELYPIGNMSISEKVLESVELIDHIIEFYPSIYDNLSEVTLNSNDEFVLILSDYPTKVILGTDHFFEKIKILHAFAESLPKQKGLENYLALDLRYNRQVIAKVRV